MPLIQPSTEDRTGIEKPFYLLVLAIVLGVFLALAGSGPAAANGLSPDDIKHYEAAFLAADHKKWPAALRHAKRASDPLPGVAVKWLYYRDQKNKASFGEIADFIESYPDWPYTSLLQKHAEQRLKGTEPDKRLLEFFAGREPLTALGVTTYAYALIRSGQRDAAVAMVRKAWVDLDMAAREEYDLRKQFRKDIKPQDHRDRLERLLWEGKTTAAKRQATRVGKAARALAEARIALRRKQGGVDGAIARVPADHQTHPGLVYERLRWRRSKGRTNSAIELLADQPDTVLREDLWWRERSILARRLLSDGKAKEAYAVASGHKATEGFPFADAEWFSGFIALRFLNDPETAFKHFQAMYMKVRFPVSLSRGAYWAGRAADAAGKTLIAYKWYDVAAQHSTSFYGQMAAHHLSESKRPALPEDPRATAEEAAGFEADTIVRLVPLLTAVKARKPAATLLRHLGRNAETPAEFAMAADLAISVGHPGEAVYISRQAIKAGTVLVTAGYPTVPAPNGLALPPEIVFGLIRQESGFDQYAISSAGARGLMQLMPATAKNVAKKQRLTYKRSKLLTDTGYNVQLGTAYLDGLLGRVDGSLILALAGYNAGPSRARQWMKNFGDPRGSMEAAIDWIEMIPFTETRNYVQRVLENITVYRQRSAVTPVVVAFDTHSITAPPATQ